jgi:AcrR family transcriptional regulator
VSKTHSDANSTRHQPKQDRSQVRVEKILDTCEQMLIELGYKNTTTRAIASRCQIPIGSIYQFFPDKEAIILALAERYNEQITALFRQLHQNQPAAWQLSDYVEQVIATMEQFCTEHPSYLALFTQIQELMPELLQKDLELNSQLVQEFANFFQKRQPQLGEMKASVIALVIVEITGTLLWVSFEQESALRASLLAETRCLLLSYLQYHCLS